MPCTYVCGASFVNVPFQLPKGWLLHLERTEGQTGTHATTRHTMRHSKFWALYALAITGIAVYLFTTMDMSRGIMWLALFPMALASMIGIGAWINSIETVPAEEEHSAEDIVRFGYWPWDQSPEVEKGNWDKYIAKCEAKVDRGTLATSADAAKHMIERGNGELAYQITPEEAAAWERASNAERLYQECSASGLEQPMRTAPPPEMTQEEWKEWAEHHEEIVGDEEDPTPEISADEWREWCENNCHYDHND